MDLIKNVAAYDLLIVPGGPSTGPDSPVQKQANDLNSPFMKLINAFAQIKPRSDENPPILL